MCSTVSSFFENFNIDIVNLDTEQTKKARISRDALLGTIRSLSADGYLPKSYSEKDVLFGSFARNTKIRPLDDIDLMICFSGCGSTYQKNFFDDNAYDILVPDNVDLLSPLVDDYHQLNSRKLLDSIKSSLKDINYYYKAELHRNQEAVTLKLKSYDWNFDIVPCFFTVDNFYLIPDGQGKWKKTDTRIDKDYVTNINQAKNGKVLQLIRTLKYWKRLYWRESISSYMFELMMLRYSLKKRFTQSFQQLVSDAFEYLSLSIFDDINDPKGIQGNLNNLDFSEKSRLRNIANNSLILVRQAISYENQGLNILAVCKWKEVFRYV